MRLWKNIVQPDRALWRHNMVHELCMPGN